MMDRSSASGLLWELKDLLACNFVSRSVAHNPLCCNMVAHSLAALGADLSPNLVSVRDSIPPCTYFVMEIPCVFFKKGKTVMTYNFCIFIFTI